MYVETRHVAVIYVVRLSRSFDIDVLNRISGLYELLVKMLKSAPIGKNLGTIEWSSMKNTVLRSLPNCLSHWPCRFTALENVTCESLNRRMLCDKSDVAMVSRMKSAERDIFKGIKVVYAWLFGLLGLIK